MIEFLRHTCAKTIASVHVNTTQFDTQAGRAVVVKRRKPLHTWLYPAGNLFLDISGSNIRMLTRARDWMDHELGSYKLLHGPEKICGIIDHNSLFIEVLPGQSLRELAQTNTLTSTSIIAAAHELRRAHSLRSATWHDRWWSHGDLHLGNVLFDGHRAWLIDFETQHTPTLDAAERHTDDLLVVVLEVMGLADNAWFDKTTAFLHAYGNLSVLATLAARLQAPSGFKALLWSIHSHHLPTNMLTVRLEKLRGWLLSSAS